MTAQTFGRCTVYTRSEFMGNIVKRECRSAEVARVPYAQYADAIQVKIVKKGARRARGWTITYHPYLLILDGHGHPEPAGMMDGGRVIRAGDGVTVIQSAHASHDDAWAQDFDALIEGHIAKGARILYDARGAEIRGRLQV